MAGLQEQLQEIYENEEKKYYDANVNSLQNQFIEAVGQEQYKTLLDNKASFSFERNALGTLLLFALNANYNGPEDRRAEYLLNLTDINSYKEEKAHVFQQISELIANKDYKKITEIYFDGMRSVSPILTAASKSPNMGNPKTNEGKLHKLLSFAMADAGQELHRYSVPVGDKQEYYVKQYVKELQGKDNKLPENIEERLIWQAGESFHQGYQVRILSSIKSMQECAKKQDYAALGTKFADLVNAQVSYELSQKHYAILLKKNPQGHQSDDLSTKMLGDYGMLNMAFMDKRVRNWMNELTTQIQKNPDRVMDFVPMILNGNISSLLKITPELNEDGTYKLDQKQRMVLKNVQTADLSYIFDKERNEQIKNFEEWSKSVDKLISHGHQNDDIYKHNLSAQEKKEINRTGFSFSRNAYASLCISVLMKRFIEEKKNPTLAEKKDYLAKIFSDTELLDEKYAVGKEIYDEYKKRCDPNDKNPLQNSHPEAKKYLTNKIIEGMDLLNDIAEEMEKESNQHTLFHNGIDYQKDNKDSFVFTKLRFTIFDLSQDVDKFPKFHAEYRNTTEEKAKEQLILLQNKNGLTQGASNILGSYYGRDYFIRGLGIQKNQNIVEEIISSFVLVPIGKGMAEMVGREFYRQNEEALKNRENLRFLDDKVMGTLASMSSRKEFTDWKEKVAAACMQDDKLIGRIMAGIQSGEIFQLIKSEVHVDSLGTVDAKVKFPTIEELSNIKGTVTKDLTILQNPARFCDSITIEPPMFGDYGKEYFDILTNIKKGFDDTRTLIAKPSAEYTAFYNKFSGIMEKFDRTEYRHVNELKKDLNELMQKYALPYQTKKLNNPPLHGQQPNRLKLMNQLSTICSIMNQEKSYNPKSADMLKYQLASKIVTEKALLLCRSSKQMEKGLKELGKTDEIKDGSFVVKPNSFLKTTSHLLEKQSNDIVEKRSFDRMIDRLQEKMQTEKDKSFAEREANGEKIDYFTENPTVTKENAIEQLLSQKDNVILENYLKNMNEVVQELRDASLEISSEMNKNIDNPEVKDPVLASDDIGANS